MHGNDQISTVPIEFNSGTTSFVGNAKAQESTAATRAHNTAILPIRDQSISDFLAKPYLVGSYNWTTSQTATTQLTQFAIASALGSGGVDMWFSKIKGFKNFRGTAVVKTVINASPFHQGKLIMSFLPGAGSTYTGDVTTQYRLRTRCQLTQLPNVEVDARDGAGVLRIPYIAPTDFFDLVDGTFDWGYCYLAVLSALNTGSSGTNNIEVSVFLHFEDVELSAPLYPQSGSSKGAKPTKMRPVGKAVASAEADEISSGPITSALSAVADVADALSGVPFLSQFAGPVSWVSRTASSVASIFGWAKPESQDASKVVARRMAQNMPNSTGVSNAVNLGLIHDNTVQIMDDFAGTNMDEMSFAYIKTREAFFDEFTWASSDATNTSIKTLSIAPEVFKEAYSITHTATNNYAAFVPFAYLTRYFQYWRGGIKLRLKFVKTDFHTGRLLITFNPTRDSGLSSVPDNSTSAYGLREIVDIAGKSEICLTLPYLLNTLWSETAGADRGYDAYLTIRVLNNLRAPETAASSIKVLMYASASDDFEYSSLTIGSTSTSAPFFPQAGKDISESNEELIEEVIGGYDISKLSLEPTSLCIGEQFTSIKQLISKYTPIFSVAPFTTASFTMDLYPFSMQLPTTNSTSNAVIYPNYFGDFLTELASGYAFYRGSVRVIVASNSNTGPLYATLGTTKGKTNTFGNTLAANSLWNDVFTSAAWNSVVTFGGSMISDAYTGLHEFKIPYYCKTKSSYVRPISTVPGSNTLITPFTDPISGYGYLDAPSSRLSIISETLTGARFFRSAADDFQLGYFVGFPPVRIS